LIIFEGSQLFYFFFNNIKINKIMLLYIIIKIRKVLLFCQIIRLTVYSLLDYILYQELSSFVFEEVLVSVDAVGLHRPEAVGTGGVRCFRQGKCPAWQR
jgi:hypothetical protein